MTMTEISPELPGEAGALIVELGDEPMRRLRHLETLAAESAVPVLVDGTISSDTENIGFGGEMTITTRVIEDTFFKGPTLLEITIDFSRVKGEGKASRKKFITAAQVVVHRPLLAFDEIEVIFPYTQGNDVHAARSAMAVITTSFSAKSGIVLTSKIKKVPLV